jgi:hypothetical protein
MHSGNMDQSPHTSPVSLPTTIRKTEPFVGLLNFRRLEEKPAEITVTSVGLWWADESYCGNFRRPGRPMEVRGLRPKFARPAAPGCHSHRTRSDLYSLSPMRHRRHSPSGRRHCPPLPAAGRHRCAPPVLLRPECCPPVMAADHPRQGHDAHRLPAVLSSAPAKSKAARSPSGPHTATAPSLMLLHHRLPLAGIVVHPQSSSTPSAAHPHRPPTSCTGDTPPAAARGPLLRPSQVDGRPVALRPSRSNRALARAPPPPSRHPGPGAHGQVIVRCHLAWLLPVCLMQVFNDSLFSVSISVYTVLQFSSCIG